jgi:hypothetical protein
MPPVMIVSHERSGTHFLMNALSYAYGYTAQPWVDLDAHNLPIDYYSPAAIAAALETQADDRLYRIVKSHHAAAFFTGELQRITETYRIFVIYRDPVSTLISLWRHLNGLAWDEGPKTRDPLALARAAPSGKLMRYQTSPAPTMLARWAGHVEGWLAAAAGNPRIVPIRYEDLDQRYEPTAAAFSPIVGREPLTPLLRSPRDVNVIAMGQTADAAPVAAAERDALRAYCRGQVGPLMARLGY